MENYTPSYFLRPPAARLIKGLGWLMLVGWLVGLVGRFQAINGVGRTCDRYQPKPRVIYSDAQ
eukprot:6919166-Prymnesium_polylepis.1